MSLLKLKCFFGFHGGCSKNYKQMYKKISNKRPKYQRLPYVKVFCKDSKKYIRTEHREDSNLTVTFFKD